MWILYNNAKTWSTRPSDLLALSDPYLRYCLDEAVSYLGGMVENELNQCEGSGSDLIRQRQKVLDYYFKDEEDAPTQGMYADPAMMFGGVKV